MAAFDWNDHQDYAPAGTAGANGAAKSAKFNWDDHGDYNPDAAKDPSLLKQAVKGTIDSLPMVGGLVGGIVGTPADVISGPLGTVAGATVGGALGESAKNLINSYYDPSSAPKSLTDAAKDTAATGLEQGTMQGAGEMAAPYVSKAIGAVAKYGGDAAKWAGKKAMSNIGGVSPDVIDAYLQNSGRINASPGVDALKNVSDDYVGNLASEVDAKKQAVDQAKSAYQDLSDGLKDQYKTAGYDARDGVTSAQQTLKDAHGARLQQLSGDVYDAVDQLKSDVTSGSRNALGVLDKSGEYVDLTPVHDAIDSTIQKLQQSGTDESLAAADKLQAYKDRIVDSHGTVARAPDAKKLIQGLDQSTTYSPMAGSFDNAKNAAFKGVRSALDQSLKDAVPEYAKAMEPVASDSALLDNLKSNGYGDRQTAINQLQRINNPNQLESKAALDQLGSKYGVDYASAADPTNLPEQALLDKATSAQDALRPDLVSSKIENTLSNSREKSALDSAIADHENAQQNLAPFKSLAPNAAGQTQAQQKLTQLGKGNNIELEGMFNKLGDLTDTDFSQAMKDQNVLNAFQKGATNGSRNTLMGALSGFMFGGEHGAMIGGAAGRAADQWGPAVTKKVLDGAISVSKSPSVEAISNLSIPDPLKKNMLLGYQNYLAQGSPASQMSTNALPNVAANNSTGGQPQNNLTGEDKWAADGVKKLGIDDATAKQLMTDQRGKTLLIQASDLAPGSKAMQAIKNQLMKGTGNT
jgi:hypothetical protein